ncbi:hypothetical protein ACHAW5_004286, partial [Stephanodiscus triporus]
FDTIRGGDLAEPFQRNYSRPALDENKHEHILTSMASGGVEGDSDEFTECGHCGISTGGDVHGFDLGSSFVKFSGCGKLLNGYPVWKRKCKRTTMLVSKIAGPAKNYLASMGIRIGHPGIMQRLLYVRKDDDLLPSLLSLTTSGHPSVIARNIARNEHALEATYVPSCMAELLTESASLFAMPDKAFSSWTMRYKGQLMEIHVAFTPYFFFEEAVSLATLAAADENEGDSNTKAASKKKRSKKKGTRCAASNTNKSIPQALSDSSLKAHTSRPDRLLERLSVVMDSTTSDAKSDNPVDNDPSIALNKNKKKHKKKKKRRVDDESKEKCEQAHRSYDEVPKIDEVTSDIVKEPQGN